MTTTQSDASERRSSRKAMLAGLMERTANGDTHAFEDLYHEVSPLVYGTAVKVLRDPDHAAEVTQEVLVDVWRTSSTFNPLAGSVLAWVATMAHRKAVDRVRSVQAQRHRDEQAGATEYQPPHDSVAEHAQRTEEQRLLITCFKTLTELQRTAVHHAYYLGQTYHEVAENVGIGLPAVKSRIRDGLKKLRQCLEVHQ